MGRHCTRAWFLGAGGAVLVAGCGHASHGGALPPAVQDAARDAATAIAPVPQFILDNPIFGETERYDGAVVPPKWMRADGRTLSRADYPELAAVLAGRERGTTFTLPKAALTIIAVRGIMPTGGPRQLAKLRPGNATRAGVAVPGIDARPAPPRPIAVEPIDPNPTWYPGTMATPELLEEQRRAAEMVFPAIRPGS